MHLFNNTIVCLSSKKIELIRWLCQEFPLHIRQRRPLPQSSGLQRYRSVLILPRHRQVYQRRRRKPHPTHGTIAVFRRNIRAIIARKTIGRCRICRRVSPRNRLIVIVPLQTRSQFRKSGGFQSRRSFEIRIERVLPRKTAAVIVLDLPAAVMRRRVSALILQSETRIHVGTARCRGTRVRNVRRRALMRLYREPLRRSRAATDAARVVIRVVRRVTVQRRTPAALGAVPSV